MTDALASNSGISASPDVITCLPVNTAKRLTKQYGDQLSTKMTTDNAVMRTIFSLEYRRLICTAMFPGTIA